MIHISNNKTNNKKRVQVSFSGEQIELIKKMSGEMGNTDAEVVRNIVISWLAEKSFISKMAKKKFD